MGPERGALALVAMVFLLAWARYEATRPSGGVSAPFLGEPIPISEEACRA
jgi:hypothetical protein